MCAHQTSLPRFLRGIVPVLLLSLASVWSALPARPAAAVQPTATSVPETFVQVANATNTVGPATLIDHPAANGKPAALIFVTANRTPPGPGAGAPGDHALGLLYDGTAARWGIANQDQAALSTGTAFNVQVVITPTAVFTHTVAVGNVDNFTMLDTPLTNGKPDALVFVTFNGSLGSGPTIYNDHALGVFYDPDLAKWGVFNQGGSSLPGGAGFNVMVRAAGSVHQASAANTAGSQTTLDLPAANGDPAAIILVTLNLNPVSGGGTFDPHNVGVKYDSASAKWSIFNEDGALMPIGAAFNVLVYGQGAPHRHVFLPVLVR